MHFYPENNITILVIFLTFFLIWIISKIYLMFNQIQFKALKFNKLLFKILDYATESNKPIFYLTGLYDINSIPTIASMNILSYVANQVALYEANFNVLCCRSLVYNNAKNILYNSYLSNQKINLFKHDSVMYITEDQWGFVCAVESKIIRDKPIALLMFGHFASESLVFSETGNYINAILISGTNNFSQVPFFVITCDYCLIGEELYALTAYLSNDNKAKNDILAIDLCKIFFIILIIYGVVVKSINNYSN